MYREAFDIGDAGWLGWLLVGLGLIWYFGKGVFR